jgi:hypothetical protein
VWEREGEREREREVEENISTEKYGVQKQCEAF